MKLCMQKKNILKILGENDKNIKMRKIGGVVLVVFKLGTYRIRGRHTIHLVIVAVIFILAARVYDFYLTLIALTEFREWCSV